MIISDNGAEFNNEIFRDGCSTFGIEHRNTTPQHPQSNGVAERFHRTLKSTLRKLINNNTSNWEKQLAPALWAYRVSDSGARGASPYQLLYGIPPDIPQLDDTEGHYELMHSARQHAIQMQERAKEKRQQRSRLLPERARHIQVHDLITIDNAEPVTLSHLRDYGYRVVSVRGKVIGYVPVTANRWQRPKHINIDRVKVVPDIDWRTLNPRPLRRRGGPDVRRNITPPPQVPAGEWQLRQEGPLQMRLLRQTQSATIPQSQEQGPLTDNANGAQNTWQVQQQNTNPLRIRITRHTQDRPTQLIQGRTSPLQQQNRPGCKRPFVADEEDVAEEPPTGRQAYDPFDNE